MKKDLHIFIIWENGLSHEEEILSDISTNFEIIQEINIKWNKSSFPRNLARFYGKKLPKGCKKSEECGTGEFLMIAAIDKNPQYHGIINANIHNAKIKYRNLCGRNIVHASDSVIETNENLLFLLGLTSEEFIKTYADKKRISLQKDIIGSPQWKNEKELLDFINKLDVKIQKNEEGYDIKTSDPALIIRFLNASKPLLSIGYSIPVGHKNLKMRIIKSCSD